MNKKREALKKIAGLSAVVALAPTSWTKPILSSVVLPVHAQTSGALCSESITETLTNTVPNFVRFGFEVVDNCVSSIIRADIPNVDIDIAATNTGVTIIPIFSGAASIDITFNGTSVSAVDLGSYTVPVSGQLYSVLVNVGLNDIGDVEVTTTLTPSVN